MSSHDIPEPQRIEAWRHDEFLRLGFSEGEIVWLQLWNADLREVERLVVGGCSPRLALRIVAPLEVVSPQAEHDPVLVEQHSIRV